MVLSLINSPKFDIFHGCHIEIDGDRIPNLYETVSEITVDASRKIAAVATLKFEDVSEADGSWAAKDSPFLKIGRKIKIIVNFGSYDETLFVGFIASTSSDYPEESGNGTYTVQCQDESVALNRVHQRINRSERNPVSDFVALGDIAQDHKLKLDDQTAKGLVSPNLMQSGSDIEFLRDRAKANGYDLMVFDGVIYFGPHRFTNHVQHVITLNAGKKTCCQNFSVSVDVNRADVIYFDIAEEKGAGLKRHQFEPNLPLLGERPAKEPNAKIGKSEWSLCQTGTPDIDEAEAYAQGLINEESLRVSATGTLDANLFGHVLVPMTVIAVDGASRDDSGYYYVDSVTHSLSHNVYTQKFKLVRNGIGDDRSGRSSNAVSVVAGLF